MVSKLKNSPLFDNMSEEEIENCLKYSKSEIITYEKDEIIFYQKDEPKKLMVLVEGTVAICNDNAAGKRSIIANIDQSGELFGEVFLFLNSKEYGHYAQAITSARVLQIPKDFFYHTWGGNHEYHNRLTSNMLSILAQKAYFLNQKVQILSCATLRQKIANVLLKNCRPDGKVLISMNREEMADFLNTARPSLSRELMNMQGDNLIRIQKRDIYITDFNKLQELL